MTEHMATIAARRRRKQRKSEVAPDASGKDLAQALGNAGLPNPFVWNLRLDVNDPILNSQHDVIMRLIQQLEDTPGHVDVLSSLCDVLENHFSVEEEMLKRSGFSKLRCAIFVNRTFYEDCLVLKDHLVTRAKAVKRNRGITLPAAVLAKPELLFIKSWFMEHILLLKLFAFEKPGKRSYSHLAITRRFDDVMTPRHPEILLEQLREEDDEEESSTSSSSSSSSSLAVPVVSMPAQLQLQVHLNFKAVLLDPLREGVPIVTASLVFCEAFQRNPWSVIGLPLFDAIAPEQNQGQDPPPLARAKRFYDRRNPLLEVDYIQYFQELHVHLKNNPLTGIPPYLRGPFCGCISTVIPGPGDGEEMEFTCLSLMIVTVLVKLNQQSFDEGNFNVCGADMGAGLLVAVMVTDVSSLHKSQMFCSRSTMMTPAQCKEVIKDAKKVIEDGRFSRQIHLPVSLYDVGIDNMDDQSDENCVPEEKANIGLPPSHDERVTHGHRHIADSWLIDCHVAEDPGAISPPSTPLVRVTRRVPKRLVKKRAKQRPKQQPKRQPKRQAKTQAKRQPKTAAKRQVKQQAKQKQAPKQGART